MTSSGESNKRVSPGREQIRGPRPRALHVGVRTDSFMIKKPAAADHLRRQPEPVVIHLRSPEIIHAKPQDFRALVQQLTGNKGSSSSRPQKFGSVVAAAVVDDYRSNKPACENSSDQNHHQVEIFSDFEMTPSLFTTKPPPLPSWPASSPSASATFFPTCSFSDMTNYVP